MKKNLLMVFLLLTAAFIMACAHARAPVSGIWYTDVKEGGDAEQGTTASTGEACAKSILGLFAYGDASIDAAKSNGNVSEVTSVDHSAWSILGIYAKYCTIVKGK